MNFNVNPNMRQRRRSNLGKRFRNGEKPPQLNFVAPVIPKTVLTSLGRSRSAKKNCFMDKASKEYITGIKKKLFQRSPQTEVILSNGLQEQNLGTRLAFDRSPTDPFSHSHNDFSEPPENHSKNPDEDPSLLDMSGLLNMTGIKIIKTPSPVKSAGSNASSMRTVNNTQHSSKSEVKQVSSLKRTGQNLFSFNPRDYIMASPRVSAAERYSVFSKVEPPKSPGPSQYHQLIMKELADIKPPVDRQEDLQLSVLSLEDKDDLSASPPAVGLATSTSIKQSSAKNDDVSTTEAALFTCTTNDGVSNSAKKIDRRVMSAIKAKSNKKLGVIVEDDSTDSFEMAEKTVFDQCQTLECSTDANKLSTFIANGNHSSSFSSDSKNASETDEELEKILEEIEQGLEDMNRMERRMRSLKTKLQCFLKNRHQSKNDTVVENKENISMNITKDQNNKWIDNLKTENPGLLKTPKPNKSRLSFADQSSIWTPHSLSTVLHEQVDDLFH
ncbi:uncharacterized protein LOC124353735 [Homalodisca vitripennis]|uniref:uncharacterized protein LOC124353735 n=2 Tax=Homalodisca vitripennis TaxID=197043 RepID=UPI001EE9EC55|nr:uncharacterized protein LOC124353735 [Homalodisca vitripennis]XP_046659679.1 uncharacterized protein LOC124353735 [Homalodisca vitripennis]